MRPPLRAAQERQTIGKSHREKELGHDRISITAVRVMVLEDCRHHLEAPDEVDEEHADHGVSAKLVEGGYSSARCRDFAHPFLSMWCQLKSPPRSGRLTADSRASWLANQGHGSATRLPPRFRAVRTSHPRTAPPPARPGGRPMPTNQDAAVENRRATPCRGSASHTCVDEARSRA